MWSGLQARLQASTAACARRGPTRPDQVSNRYVAFSACLPLKLSIESNIQTIRLISSTCTFWLSPTWLHSGCDVASSAYLAMSRSLMTVERPAGVTAGINCSLCQAGTYLTGSGRNKLCSLVFQTICLISSKCTFWYLTWLHSCCDFELFVAHYAEKPDGGGTACRRDYRPQLQPVPGRDLLDRIRSEFDI